MTETGHGFAQAGQTGLQPFTGGLGIVHQSLVLYDIERRLRGSAAHRIAPERVEIASTAGEFVQKFGFSHHRGNRQAIAHRFAHDGDIGDDVVAQKPQMESPSRAKPG